MKKMIITAAVVLFILIDIAVLLYPSVSGYFNSLSQSRAVAQYFDDTAGINDIHTQAMLKAARNYNKALLRKANRFRFTKQEAAEYKALLNTGQDVMGILSIGKIGVKLPIYHGADKSVLQIGLGHMQGTSLPVGGAGTHTFLTGHRGLPSSTLLTNLDKLSEGDTFALHILGETLTYQVDQIQTVLPDEVRALDISKDADFCTLVTCTPYGVNSHRLLVRGTRVENAASGWDMAFADAKRADKFLVLLMFLIPLLPVLILFCIIRCRKISATAKRQKQRDKPCCTSVCPVCNIRLFPVQVLQVVPVFSAKVAAIQVIFFANLWICVRIPERIQKQVEVCCDKFKKTFSANIIPNAPNGEEHIVQAFGHLVFSFPKN